MRLPNALKGLPDLERGLMRILHRTSHPAELAGTLQVWTHAGWLYHIHASQTRRLHRRKSKVKVPAL